MNNPLVLLVQGFILGYIPVKNTTCEISVALAVKTNGSVSTARMHICHVENVFTCSYMYVDDNQG
jgi:hypothetical protein